MQPAAESLTNYSPLSPRLRAFFQAPFPADPAGAVPQPENPLNKAARLFQVLGPDAQRAIDLAAIHLQTWYDPSLADTGVSGQEIATLATVLNATVDKNHVAIPDVVALAALDQLRQGLATELHGRVGPDLQYQALTGLRDQVSAELNRILSQQTQTEETSFIQSALAQYEKKRNPQPQTPVED